MKNLMIDLETFSSEPNAVIVQIGACYFDRDTGEIGQKFKMNIDPSTDTEGHISAETVKWWLQQSELARASILAEPKKSLSFALLEFSMWVGLNAEHVWSHATFDFVVLMSAYSRLGIRKPFSYRAARDIRTLLDLAPKQDSLERKGVHHDALDDAIFQVGYCVPALKALKR